MAYSDPYNYNFAEGLSSKAGGDINSAIDIGQLLTRVLEGNFNLYGPLQENVVGMFNDLINGDTGRIDKMFAPINAAMQSQVGHSVRNIQDNVQRSQQGDALAKLGQNAITAKAGAYNNFLQPYFQSATELGKNALMTQWVPGVSAAGQIMKKPGSSGGMS